MPGVPSSLRSPHFLQQIQPVRRSVVLFKENCDATFGYKSSSTSVELFEAAGAQMPIHSSRSHPQDSGCLRDGDHRLYGHSFVEPVQIVRVHADYSFLKESGSNSARVVLMKWSRVLGG